MAPYDAKKTEEEILEFWKKNSIHSKIQKRNKDGKKFYFLQGPPYTSGRLHIAHAWNNSLKDIAMRYKRMQGFDVWDRAGYDMHGLPTANKVQKALKLKDKDEIVKFGLDKFAKECQKFSIDNKKLMDQDLIRLGIWMDYKNAYLPVTNEFMSSEWLLIKKAHEQDRLYKGKKIMHWCGDCETSLAKHELEYQTDTDTSIFLKFKVKNTDNEYLLIWTTTPWTIAYNLGVMVNPDLEYLKTKVDDEIWYISKALAGVFIQSVAGKKFEILEEFKGEKLEGMEYIHPLYDDLKHYYDEIKKESPKAHTVLLSKEYVDTTAGTGMVHCAPGCGPEDYEVGHKYGIKPFNQLNEKGEYEDMGRFTGWVAKKDDKKFIEEFKKLDILIESSEVEHEYAHCWRCKDPVVFRTTEQWFLKIEDLVPKILEYNKKIQWEPKSAKKSYEQWITNIKDNGITRQRFWGTPVPIWECDCGENIVVGSKEELEKLAKNKLPDNLHKPWIDDVIIECPKCKSDVKRIPDVLDVWIDSGTASWNCLEYPQREDYFKKYFPADLILEATEQTRLWFSMLQICSTIVFGKQCYLGAHNHGMILDISGMKMSKSLGNIISPYEVIDKYSADILRYYMCQTKAGENINFNWEEVKIKQRNLLVLWNLHKFLIDFSSQVGTFPNNIEKTKRSIEERYIISKLNSTIKKVTKLFDEYRLDETIAKIEELFLDLSRTYIQLVRDKSSTGNVEEKKTVLHTVYKVLLDSLKMFSTISPFITERIYLDFKEAFNLKLESIHLFNWPKSDDKEIDVELEKNMDLVSNVVQSTLAAREKIGLGVRWPLSEVIFVTKDEKTIQAIEKLANIIKKQTNIKEIRIQPSLPGVKTNIKVDYKQLGPDFGQKTPKIIAKLSSESPKTILSHIEKEGKFVIKVDGEDINIVKEYLIVDRVIPDLYQESTFKTGLLYVNKELDEELEAEGYSREVMRRVQNARKKAGLQKTDEIVLFIKTEEELVEMLMKHEKVIQEKCGAIKMKIASINPAKKHQHSSKEKVKSKEFEIFFD